MRRELRVFVLALPVLLLSLAGLAFWYGGVRGIPRETIVLLLPAFLLEAALYLSSANSGVRRMLSGLRPRTLFLLMAASALAPYAAYAVPSGLWQWWQIAAIAGLVTCAAGWYLALPAKPALDLLFVAFMAAPVLADVFPMLYPTPAERAPAFYLGLILWYRTGIVVLLCVRKMGGIGFGFLPSRAEWAVGVRYYLLFLPVGFALAFALQFGELRPFEASLKVLVNAVLVFAGILWVVAVAEEFFFRGVLQQTLVKLLRNDAAGLLVASVLFGLAHLGFRERFPNWPMAILAAAAGVFYGLAYRRATSIRAAMVAHALVVTTWRLLLK